VATRRAPSCACACRCAPFRRCSSKGCAGAPGAGAAGACAHRGAAAAAVRRGRRDAGAGSCRGRGSRRRCSAARLRRAAAGGVHLRARAGRRRARGAARRGRLRRGRAARHVRRHHRRHAAGCHAPPPPGRLLHLALCAHPRRAARGGAARAGGPRDDVRARERGCAGQPRGCQPQARARRARAARGGRRLAGHCGRWQAAAAGEPPGDARAHAARRGGRPVGCLELAKRLPLSAPRCATRIRAPPRRCRRRATWRGSTRGRRGTRSACSTRAASCRWRCCGGGARERRRTGSSTSSFVSTNASVYIPDLSYGAQNPATGLFSQHDWSGSCGAFSCSASQETAFNAGNKTACGAAPLDLATPSPVALASGMPASVAGGRGCPNITDAQTSGRAAGVRTSGRAMERICFSMPKDADYRLLLPNEQGVEPWTPILGGLCSVH
jgi:hypothetical protein